MLHFLFMCQHRAHDFYGIVFQTLFLETSDIIFNFRIFELIWLTLQTIQKVRNMNDVILYVSTRFNAAENSFMRERKQQYEIKSIWNIPCTICSRRNMVVSLNPSESILQVTSEVYRTLSQKRRISLVENEGCLFFSLCVAVHWHYSFWIRQRHPCKLESSTKCFFLCNILLTFPGNHDVSDICEFK